MFTEQDANEVAETLNRLVNNLSNILGLDKKEAIEIVAIQIKKHYPKTESVERYNFITEELYRMSEN